MRAEMQEQPDAPDAVYWLITLSAGEHAARARIAWAREALELLDRATAGASSLPEPTERPEGGGEPSAPA